MQLISPSGGYKQHGLNICHHFSCLITYDKLFFQIKMENNNSENGENTAVKRLNSRFLCIFLEWFFWGKWAWILTRFSKKMSVNYCVPRAEVTYYVIYKRTALTWFISLCLPLCINYEVRCFRITNNFPLIDKESCFPMNFLLFINLEDSDLGDFGVILIQEILA